MHLSPVPEKKPVSINEGEQMPFIRKYNSGRVLQSQYFHPKFTIEINNLKKTQ